MVLEKLVRLGFDDKTGKLVIAETKEEAINPQQLSGIIVLEYFQCRSFVDRMNYRENMAPKGSNAYLSNFFVNEHGVINSSTFHPLIYYCIDEAQAQKAPKQEIKDMRNLGSVDGFDGEAD